MNCAPPYSDNTFVIAAVKVVLPWSTCPIVPMLQCGLLLLNFSFDILLSLHFFCFNNLERVKGIEPLHPAWKASVLPLNYTRVTQVYHSEVKVY